MSQQLPENSDSQQPDANSTQQADISTPQNVVQGNQNRVVQGDENQSVLGDSNTVIQGNNNLMLTIKELILRQQTTIPVGNPARPKNERILLAAVKEEVTARLRQSLHNAVLINLGKESQPQQVKRPWDAEIKIGLKPAEPIPATTSILEVFDSEEIAGKFLILGEPGAGKTTTMLDLAKALIARAELEINYPIPVLLNLSTWKDNNQLIQDWLVMEIKSKYGVRQDISMKWIDDAKLLPMLDGLDELEPVLQEHSVQKINEFLQSDNRPQYFVICSRREEYRNYVTNLQLNGAIFLQNLSESQIQDYLISIKQENFWQIFQSHSKLLELLQKPLLLNITIISYNELLLEDWQKITSTTEYLKLLLNAYIKRMLSRELENKSKKQPNDEQTQQWLSFIANQLQQGSETEFLIEKMQPNYLDSCQHEIYRQVFGLVYASALGLVSALMSGLFYNLTFLEITGKIGFAAGLIWAQFPFINQIKSVENFQNLLTYNQNNQNLNNLIQYLKNTVIISFIVAIFSVSNRPMTELIVGLTTLTIAGLFIGLNEVLTVDVETCSRPNQGIFNSLKTIIGLVTTGFIITLIAKGLLSQFFSEIFTKQMTDGLISAFAALLFCFIFFSFQEGGGQASIQHFTLRLVLYFNGYIPWNYARFLDYCTERMLLQRVGGRYRFIHKLLQDHFAKMEFKRD